MRYLAYLVPAAVRRPLAGIAVLLAVFAFLRLSAPSPRGIDFAPPAEGVDPAAPSPVPLAERLLPVHALALCLETLAQRITVESTAAFEVFDHAYRDECRSSIAGNPQWRLASEWFGPLSCLRFMGFSTPSASWSCSPFATIAPPGVCCVPPCSGARRLPRWLPACASSCACSCSPTPPPGDPVQV